MRRRLLQNDKINIAKAIDGVFSRQGVYEYLPSIKTPTLIVVGDEDIATIPAKSRRMNTAIQGSQLVVIPHAGHTSTIETPDAVTGAIREFLHNLALNHVKYENHSFTVRGELVEPLIQSTSTSSV
jgi:3-oxoadipate enol-lactonase